MTLYCSPLTAQRPSWVRTRSGSTGGRRMAPQPRSPSSTSRWREPMVTAALPTPMVRTMSGGPRLKTEQRIATGTQARISTSSSRGLTANGGSQDTCGTTGQGNERRRHDARVSPLGLDIRPGNRTRTWRVTQQVTVSEVMQLIGGSLLGVAVLVMLDISAPADGTTALVELKLTQKYLQPLCVNGTRVDAGQRLWRLELREQSLAFTMRNEPRPGSPDSPAQPGVAVIGFMPEAGHKYEVEVRAPEASYAWRVWRQGEWRPVVRDRTVDRVVSSEPEWRESPCGP